MHHEVNPKVVAASGGAGVGYALGVIAVYYLEQVGGNVPTRVEDAMLVVLTAALAFGAGWVKGA